MLCLLLLLSTSVFASSEQKLKEFDDLNFNLTVGNDVLAKERTLVIEAKMRYTGPLNNNESIAQIAFTGNVQLHFRHSQTLGLWPELLINNVPTTTFEVPNIGIKEFTVRLRKTNGIVFLWVSHMLVYMGQDSDWLDISKIVITGDIEIDDISTRGQSYPMNWTTRLVGGLQDQQHILAFFYFPERAGRHMVEMSLQDEKTREYFNFTVDLNQSLLIANRTGYAGSAVTLGSEEIKKKMFWMRVWINGRDLVKGEASYSPQHLMPELQNNLGGHINLLQNPVNFNLLHISGTAELHQIELTDLFNKKMFDQCDTTKEQLPYFRQ